MKRRRVRQHAGAVLPDRRTEVAMGWGIGSNPAQFGVRRTPGPRPTGSRPPSRAFEVVLKKVLWEGLPAPIGLPDPHKSGLEAPPTEATKALPDFLNTTFNVRDRDLFFSVRRTVGGTPPQRACSNRALRPVVSGRPSCGRKTLNLQSRCSWSMGVFHILPRDSRKKDPCGSFFDY